MLHKPCVLLVEDDADVSLLLSAYLKQRDLEVTCVRGTQEATAMIETSMFDAVVLDVMLPDLEAISYLNWLRETRVNDIPVIVHTSVVDPQHLRMLKQSGASRIVEKPTHPDTLVRLINDCIIDHEKTLVNTTIARMPA